MDCLLGVNKWPAYENFTGMADEWKRYFNSRWVNNGVILKSRNQDGLRAMIFSTKTKGVQKKPLLKGYP